MKITIFISRVEFSFKVNEKGFGILNMGKCPKPNIPFNKIFTIGNYCLYRIRKITFPSGGLMNFGVMDDSFYMNLIRRNNMPLKARYSDNVSNEVSIEYLDKVHKVLLLKELESATKNEHPERAAILQKQLDKLESLIVNT